MRENGEEVLAKDAESRLSHAQVLDWLNYRLPKARSFNSWIIYWMNKVWNLKLLFKMERAWNKKNIITFKILKTSQNSFMCSSFNLLQDLVALVCFFSLYSFAFTDVYLIDIDFLSSYTVANIRQQSQNKGTDQYFEFIITFRQLDKKMNTAHVSACHILAWSRDTSLA